MVTQFLPNLIHVSSHVPDPSLQEARRGAEAWDPSEHLLSDANPMPLIPRDFLRFFQGFLTMAVRRRRNAMKPTEPKKQQRPLRHMPGAQW